MKTIEILSSVEELKKIDAFHPPEENSNTTLYNEWHYFNVMDEEQHLSVICTFKLSGIFNASQILFAYYTNDGISNTYFKVYPINIAEYSSQTPEVKIANSTVKLTPDGYSVYVESDDGTKVLDALFKQEAEPSLEYEATNFSSVYGGVIKWLVASPKMKVNGKLTIDGKTYILNNAKGYHDHNWGYWNWGDIGWIWGQVTQNADQTKINLKDTKIGEYSLNFGIISDPVFTYSLMKVLNIWSNQEIVATFSDRDLQIKHSNFVNMAIPINSGAILPSGSFPLPLTTDIFVSSETGNYLNIKFETEVGNSVPILAPIPTIDASGNQIKDKYGNTSMKYRIIWEMIGTYQIEGKIRGKSISFTADGFMEYVLGESILPEPQS